MRCALIASYLHVIDWCKNVTFHNVKLHFVKLCQQTQNDNEYSCHFQNQLDNLLSTPKLDSINVTFVEFCTKYVQFTWMPRVDSSGVNIHARPPYLTLTHICWKHFGTNETLRANDLSLEAIPHNLDFWQTPARTNGASHRRQRPLALGTTTRPCYNDVATLLILNTFRLIITNM